MLASRSFCPHKVWMVFCPQPSGQLREGRFFYEGSEAIVRSRPMVGVAWASIVDQVIYELKAERAGILEDAPFSAIFIQDPRNVLGTIHALKDERLFRLEEMDEGLVVFPTPKLVEKVMGKVPVAVA